MSKPPVITLRFCFFVWIHQSQVYGTVKNELWKIFTLSRRFIIIALSFFFVRRAHQQRLMQSVNFSSPRCIGNTSAALHLSLRSWLLKVDSKHGLCWLSACLYIRTQIVGRLTARSLPKQQILPTVTSLSSERCWTLNGYVIYLICVSSAFPFTSPSPPLPSLRPHTLGVFFPYQKEILSWNPLCPSVTYYAVAFVVFHCELFFFFPFSIIVTMLAPFISTLVSPFSQAYIMDMLWEWTLERALWSKVTHTLQDSVPIRANNNEASTGSINNHQGCHRTTCVPVCTSSSGRRGNQMIIIDVRGSLSLSLSLSAHPPLLSADTSAQLRVTHSYLMTAFQWNLLFRAAVSGNTDWVVNYAITPPQALGNGADINKYTECKLCILMALITCQLDAGAEWCLTRGVWSLLYR